MGVYVYLDILIVDLNKAEYDQRLFSVLSILQDRNVKLNKSKCVVNVTDVPYLGYILTSNGIKADP